MKNSPKAIIAVAVVVICGLGYYFFYFVKTPLYSGKLIADAFRNRDILLFEQHVDVHSIVDKGYENFLRHYMQQQNQKVADNPFTIGFAQMLKPVIVEKAAEEINAGIQEHFSREEKQLSVTGQQADSSGQNQRKHIKVKDVIQKSCYDNEAVVVLLLENVKGEEMKIRCRMEKLPNGEWKVTEIMNLADIIEKLERK